MRKILSILLVALSFSAAAQSLPNFDQLEAKLKIRPEQKEQYDVAVAATERALLAVGLAALQMKDALSKELAKNYPDFRALVRKQDELIEQQRPLFREAGRQWEKLYKLLDAKQAKTVQVFLDDNLGSFFK